MDIQTQNVAATTTNATNGTQASHANGSTSAGGAFSATLNGMLVGEVKQPGDSANGTSNGLGALIQLLAPLTAAASVLNEQAIELQEAQIDGLIQLLEQPKQQEDVDLLLSNPDLQAWLAELQALLASMVSADAGAQAGDTTEKPLQGESAGELLLREEALNPFLFIPIANPANSGTSEDVANVGALSNKNASLSAADVIALLKQLKSMLNNESSRASLHQMMKELPSVILSAARTNGEVHKAKSDTQQTAQAASLTKANPDSAAPASSPLVQVVSNPMQKLEALAVNQHVLKVREEQASTEQESPLFEPLLADEGQAEGSHPITMHDFMKQVQSGQAVPKTVSLQMPASSFADDMTQFVISSFVLGTSADGLTEAKISLYPQHLGHVEVKLTMQNGHLIAQFVADSAAGKEMLEAQLSQLRSTLQTQGIQVDKLEVSQSQSYQSGMFQEGRQQQQSQQSSKQKNSNSPKLASMDELGEGEEAADSRINRTADNGSIDITA